MQLVNMGAAQKAPPRGLCPAGSAQRGMAQFRPEGDLVQRTIIPWMRPLAEVARKYVLRLFTKKFKKRKIIRRLYRQGA